ncbi:uncharacterized protein F4807DRAFT_41398 [Annulohypoxylon truncatum]|uniref:uncharacterized protein n=1 Tax=Annulohypoxylon truncatum TaxID=327061 RepID=UPI0020080A1A|nr:uncharacterized protein F4807DRAFT_41398 [Annulohypoxylon truncatum]KAI1210862.1 hypothetical protein F4807DRAFT_41398 [Annulohypoxylon truncatum]
MDNPEAQVERVIRALTVQSRQDQADALEEYFLPDAYFIHPFCRVPSFGDRKIPLINQTINSRWFIFFIYQWYRILSPDIKLTIDSASFDKKNDLLYCSIRQKFTLWFVPFSLWQANVRLVTVLELKRKPTDRNNRPILNGRPSPDIDDLSLSYQPNKLYFIKGQEDHYQVEDFLKFIAPWGASLLWFSWQLFATFICAAGVLLLRKPIVVLRERVLGLDSRAIKKE